MWNVTQGTNGVQNIGSHDQPIRYSDISISMWATEPKHNCPFSRAVRYIQEKNLVVTGSWDKTVSFCYCKWK